MIDKTYVLYERNVGTSTLNYFQHVFRKVMENNLLI